MNPRVALIGAGGIGARHLQGMMRVGQEIAIDVVDPSDAARKRAFNLATEIDRSKAAGIVFHADLSTLRSPELAIVATNARERAKIVSDLLKVGARRFVLEKVLFTRLSDYDVIEELLARSGSSAWVNCGRRAYPRAIDLAARVAGRRFDYRVDGEGWGLACNVIHHLDEFAMLNGETDVVLSGDKLNPGTIAAKRTGYIEFLGTLTGVARNGSRFAATCGAGEAGDRIVMVSSDNIEMLVSQSKQTLSTTDGNGTREEPFPIPFQSETTADHVNAIIDGREPALTSYSDAASLHRRMLKVFLDHLRTAVGDPSIEECPIT